MNDQGEYVIQVDTRGGRTYTSVPIDSQGVPAARMAETLVKRCDAAAFHLPVKAGEFVIIPISNVECVRWVAA